MPKNSFFTNFLFLNIKNNADLLRYIIGIDIRSNGFQCCEALYQFISYNIVEAWASCSKRIILLSNLIPLQQILIALFGPNQNRNIPIKTITRKIIKIKKEDAISTKSKSNFKIKHFFRALSPKFWQTQTVPALPSSSTTWSSPPQTVAKLRPTKTIADNSSSSNK